MPPFLSPLIAGSSSSSKRKHVGGDDNPQARKKVPLVDLTDDTSDSSVTHISTTTRGVTRYWNVQWRKPQTKVHKTWDADGVLIVGSGHCELRNMDNEKIVSARTEVGDISAGDELKIAGKDVYVDHEITHSDYLSGRCFGAGGFPSTISASSPAPYKPFIPKVTMKSIPARQNPPSSHRASEPLVDSANTMLSQTSISDEPVQEQPRYWSAQWRKPQGRKNKTWDGDAVISQCGMKIMMYSEKGDIMGSATYKLGKLSEGTSLFISGKEIEIDSKIRAPAFATGDSTSSARIDPDEAIWSRTLTAPVATKFIPPVIASSKPSSSSSKTAGTSKVTVPIDFYGQPKKNTNSHNPDAPGALVMPAPSKAHMKRYNPKGLSVNTVVVDPAIAKHLRPHQREGVQFLYECVMGMKKHEGRGCILADEMGLGKTIQTIVLIWTLLRQNPYGSDPVLGKVLIVCPVTLLHNWRKEIYKWLGRERVSVLVGEKDAAQIKLFLNSRHQILVIGYEKLRSVIDDLAYCHPPIGLVVCDEGHRIKSSQSLTTKALETLKTPRRIVLSGTPVQNNLKEFHVVTNFCNPGLLDDYKTFLKLYEGPILKSRTPDCGTRDRELGNARAAELAEMSKSFVLRRTADILAKYLPPKHEYVIFVRPTALQLEMFAKILNPNRVADMIAASGVKSLSMIGLLGKLSNSPMLLINQDPNKPESALSEAKIAAQSAAKLIPSNAQLDDETLSGKMMVLAKMLRTLRKDTDEKVVIVSHYTATLNVIEKFCKRKSYSYSRLDGTTKPDTRQTLVDQFNKAQQADKFVFLLSAKAGGQGIALHGASRLVLFDSDWNPAHDLQAMARIHRDGQKRDVFIYRLLTAGTIDEKIYQRGVTKTGLSESLMTAGGTEEMGISKGDSFSQAELRDIFTVHEHAVCHTHELLGCRCLFGTEDGLEPPERTTPDTESDAEDIDDFGSDSDSDQMKGFVPASQIKPPKPKKKKREAKAGLAALDQWTHVHAYNPLAYEAVHDSVLVKLMQVQLESELGAQGTTEEPARRQSLLDAINVHKLPKTDEGNITFVFQRIADTPEAPLDD